MHFRYTSETFRTLLCAATLLFAAQSGFAQTRYATGDIVEDAVLLERGTDRPVSLRSLEGKIVFIDWFAWWCSFCQSAASQIKPGIDDHYAARGHTNANGVPIVHVMVNLQPDQEEQTQSFLNSYGLGSLLVLEDFQRTLANRFQPENQPIFAIINGVAGSPSHGQWGARDETEIKAR